MPGTYPASGGTSDPIVPGDGTQNLTGALTVSGIVTTPEVKSSVGGLKLTTTGATTPVYVVDDASAAYIAKSVDAVTGSGINLGGVAAGDDYFIQMYGGPNQTAGITVSDAGLVTLKSDTGVLVDGSADVVQLTVQGHSTQTTLPFVVENSAGTDVFTVSNAGAVTAGIEDAGIIINDPTVNSAYPTIVHNDGALNKSTGWSFMVGAGGDTRINGSVGYPVLFYIGGSAATNTASIGAVAANATALGGQAAFAHISGGGGLTTGVVAGAGAGTPSAANQSGNDIGGSVGITCGTAGTVGNPIVTITFADAYATAPFCTISPANAATAAAMVLSQIYPVTTTTTLAIQCGGGTAPTGTLLWNYHCTQ